MCRGMWRIWVQVKNRGRWQILQDEEGIEYGGSEEEDAILFCFLRDMGPRYELWFRKNWFPRSNNEVRREAEPQQS